MTRATSAASAVLARELSALTGCEWLVDESYTAGEAAMLAVWSGRDWRARPAVVRDLRHTLRICPRHPERERRQRLGTYSGRGWQQRAAVDAVVALRDELAAIAESEVRDA